jgi:dienelactone hydrolase
MFIFGCILLAGACIALPAQAWEGFSWEKWQSDTGVTRPTIDSPQAGHSDLLPLLEDSTPITTPAQWEAKRKGIMERLAVIFGTPSSDVKPEPEAEVLGTEDLGSYDRVHVRIASEPDDTIPAYILRPKQRPDGRQPVMIVLHQTQAPGKQEACGMTGDPEMAFAKELAERGVLCIVPDAIGFGERIREGGRPYDGAHKFYEKHPQWSFFGKMLWDVGRIIDYLETLPEVDASRIGVIGHSHGAYGSITAAVFEPRIALAVASCGFNTLRADPDPNRWSHLTALMPRLGFYVDAIEEAPFDWHEIIACIAPRPYFNWATADDSIFPNTGNLPEIYAQVKDVYALYGKADVFTGHLAPGPHKFPASARQEAYAWIERSFSED